MLAENVGQQEWFETFRAVLHYYVPPLGNTPLINVGGLVAILAGLFLVFRGGKFERFVVSVFALILGGWLGHRLALFANTPGPITVAITAIILSVIAYKTFRWWLAVGSVLVLFWLGLTFELGRGDLQSKLLKLAESQTGLENGLVRLPADAREQLRNLHENPWDRLEMLQTGLADAMKHLGPAGWVLPLAAAVAGGLLAYWALRVFVVVWLGFAGANLAVLGGISVLCAHWPNLRDSILAHPQVPMGIVIGLWFLGLVLQAKEARFPKKPSGTPEKVDAKS